MQKGKIPKIKKKLKDFLTDESGKITKKDALGMSIGAALISGASNIDSVSAGHNNSWRPNNPVNDNGTFYHNPTCPHVSGIVHGHYSNIPTISSTESVTHGSHSSHGNHENGGWC